MTTIPENCLNNAQLINISKKLDGITKESNDSIFSAASNLDENKNQTLETNEVSVNKLLSLGNTILNKIAEYLGIDVSDSQESKPMESFNDIIQNEPIIQNHFAPIMKVGQNATMQDLKDGKLNGLLTIENVMNTINSIIQEKESLGIKITERTDNHIIFSDGSEIGIVMQENQQDNSSNISSMSYTSAAAADGSRAYVTVTPDYTEGESAPINSIGSLSIVYTDGNAPSKEVIDNNTTIGLAGEDGKREIDVDFEEVNKHDHAESYSQDMEYSNNGSTSKVTIGEEHTKGTGEGWKYLDPIKQKTLEYSREVNK